MLQSTLCPWRWRRLCSQYTTDWERERSVYSALEEAEQEQEQEQEQQTLLFLVDFCIGP